MQSFYIAVKGCAIDFCRMQSALDATSNDSLLNDLWQARSQCFTPSIMLTHTITELYYENTCIFILILNTRHRWWKWLACCLEC